MTTEELLDLVLTDRLRGLHTSMPGRVESYDASNQTADVLPQIKRQMPDGEGGFTIEDLPVLPGIPVGHPRGGGFFASFPLQKGDFVWVMFAERPIGNWRQKGQASNPGDNRMHSLAGAVCIPAAIYPSNKTLQDADDTNMVIGKDGTSAAQIIITPSMVKLGGGDQFVALANLVKERLDTIQSTFDGHNHDGSSLTANLVSGAITGITGAPGSPIGSLAPVAAHNVKAT